MPTDDRYWDQRDENQPPRRSKVRSRPSKAWVWWLAGGFAGLSMCGLLCCGGGYFGIRSFLGPTKFPHQTEDYAEARAKFHTKLVRRGPAPQRFQPEWPPPDVREVSYPFGVVQLRAWMNQPNAAGGPKPAVLFLHGGFALGADDWEQAQPFRDAGFVTMLPILRGENGQPGDYSMFYDEVDDVLAAADSLAKEPGVDPNRIYVSGHSVGGTLALLAAMTSKRFRAAASFSGSPDQVKWANGQMELVPFDPKDQREFEMRSPLAFARSFKCPTRLYFGSQEILFKSSSEKTAELARAAGLDVQAVSVPGDHMTAVTPGMRQAITFFQQNK